MDELKTILERIKNRAAEGKLNADSNGGSNDWRMYLKFISEDAQEALDCLGHFTAALEALGQMSDIDNPSTVQALELSRQKMIRLLQPLKEIAERWYDNSLDESRPDWGESIEKASKVEMVSGRGGGCLLTLAQCFEVNDFLGGKKVIIPGH